MLGEVEGGGQGQRRRRGDHARRQGGVVRGRVSQGDGVVFIAWRVWG